MKSRVSEEQIFGILREAEAGSPIKAVSAAHNISTATHHAWKRKFGGMEVSEAKRLRGLEEENSRLKRLVADQAVQIHILEEVNAKSGEPVCKTTGREDEYGRGHWTSGSGLSCAGTLEVEQEARVILESWRVAYNEQGGDLKGAAFPSTPSAETLG